MCMSAICTCPWTCTEKREHYELWLNPMPHSDIEELFTSSVGQSNQHRSVAVTISAIADTV